MDTTDSSGQTDTNGIHPDANLAGAGSDGDAVLNVVDTTWLPLGKAISAPEVDSNVTFRQKIEADIAAAETHLATMRARLTAPNFEHLLDKPIGEVHALFHFISSHIF